jgi:predicted ATPase
MVAMISRLHVKGFKCLLDVDIPLGPFTVLIGPNDSGKSSLLEAIQLLGRTGKQPYNQVFAPPASLDNLVWRRDKERTITWEVQGTASGREFSYRLELSPKQSSPVAEELTLQGQRRLVLRRVQGQAHAMLGLSALPGMPWQDFPLHQQWQTGLLTASAVTGGTTDLGEVAASLASSVKYRLDPQQLRQEAADLQPEPTLDPTGRNLVKALDAIQNSPERSAFRGLEEALNGAIPTLHGVFLPLLPHGRRGLAFTLSGNGAEQVSIPAALASDGALLITAILALAYGDAPAILFFEEPENGLHYSLLKLAIDLLRKISAGAVGNQGRQVIITTHSPLLLNFARPEEVLVFRRSAEEGTKVTPLKEAPNIDKLLREFGTGELWYLLGEEALVKERLP